MKGRALNAQINIYNGFIFIKLATLEAVECRVLRWPLAYLT